MGSRNTRRVKRPLILLGAGLCLVLVTFAIFEAFKFPRLKVLMIDEQGKPVPGARIEPDGIRGTDGGHYGWGDWMQVKPVPVTTAADGRATIEYPKFITERVRSIQLSFGVKHPQFGAERPFIDVAAPVTSATPWKERLLSLAKDLRRKGRVETVTLKRAGTVVLRASLNGNVVAGPNFHAMLESQEGVFGGAFLREGEHLVSRQVPSGLFLLRAVYLAGDTNYFSAVQKGVAAAGATNVFEVVLTPGLSITGRVTHVDGPLRNGWVNARVLSGGSVAPEVREELTWADYTQVQEDGTFVLHGLPAGRLESVALCDGYMSKRPEGAAGGYDALPVTLELPSAEELILEMEKTATARVEVRDSGGNPLKGASVHFWPNIQWAQRWSTIFGSDFYRTAETLGKDPRKIRRTEQRKFSAKTDQQGVAWVRELPRSVKGLSSFAVDHDLYELPLNDHHSREDKIALRGGETNFMQVRMEKKGGRKRE